MKPRRILVIAPDLMFGPRIAATARQLGIDVQEATADGALAAWQASPHDLAIVDLHGPGNPVALVASLKDCAPDRRVFCFCRHTATDLIRAARAAGADHVVPRSAFFPNLARILETGEIGV